MLTTTRHFLSLIRFSHTVFALPFALMAALLAWRLEDTVWRWSDLAGILLAMVAARSAAMAFNRLADRRYDAANPRTASRHLPAGTLSVKQVAVFAAAASLLFVAGTLLFLPNKLPLWLSAPVLVFLLGYSYAKRFTPFAHVWLGAALALAPIAAWIAIRGEQVLESPADLLPAATLGLAVLTWVTGFDILYACQDIDFDRKAGLQSIPAKLGVLGALRTAACCHVLTVAALAVLPVVYPSLGWVYGLGLIGVACLLTYEHLLVRPNDLARVNLAFFHTNAVISLGLLAVIWIDLVLY